MFGFTMEQFDCLFSFLLNIVEEIFGGLHYFDFICTRVWVAGG
jgi:hypothetical protein